MSRYSVKSARATALKGGVATHLAVELHVELRQAAGRTVDVTALQFVLV